MIYTSGKISFLEGFYTHVVDMFLNKIPKFLVENRM